MPETVHINGDDAFHHFLSEGVDLDTLVKIYPSYSPTVEVCLTINGVEVPFAKSLKKIYALFQSSVDKQAAELVASKLDGIEELHRTIDESREAIRSKIEQVFGVRLD